MKTGTIPNLLLTCIATIIICGCGNNSSTTSVSPAPTPPPVPPSINSVSPTVLAAGSPESKIVVTGSGFISGSAVQANGTNLATTFDSPTQLIAFLPASLLLTSGTLQISVVNSSLGGLISGKVPLSVVAVGSLSLFATPEAGPADGPWTLSAVAFDPSGKPLPDLPISFGASSGSLSQLTGSTDSNGGFIATITPQAIVDPLQPVVVTATSGSQTAAVNIVFENLAPAAARSASSTNNSNPTFRSASLAPSDLSSSIQPFAFGTSGTPSSTNPFQVPNNCYTDTALTTTVTIACQQIYTQNGLSIRPSNLINEACNAIDKLGTFADALSCVGTGVTIISCLTGIAEFVCAGVLEVPFLSKLAGGAFKECVQFIATQLTKSAAGNAAAQLVQQLFVLQDPKDPANLIQEGCIVLQDLFPASNGAPGGRVYVADSSANVMKVYDSLGTAISVSGTFPGLSTPDGMAYNPSNQHIYVANLGNNTVTVYDLQGNLIDLGPNAFDGLNDPEDITFDPINRQFYINEPSPNLVVVFDESGNPVTLKPGAFANLSSPFGLGWDSANGLIYVTNAGNNTMTVYDQLGNQIQTAVGAFAGLNSPDDVSWDPLTGNLYITGAASDGLGTCSVNQIFVYAPDGTAISPSGGFPGLNGPDAVFSNGNAAAPMYYITNICGGSVNAYDRNGTPITLPSGAFGGLVQPTGVLVIP